MFVALHYVVHMPDIAVNAAEQFLNIPAGR